MVHDYLDALVEIVLVEKQVQLGIRKFQDDRVSLPLGDLVQQLLQSQEVFLGLLIPDAANLQEIDRLAIILRNLVLERVVLDCFIVSIFL